MNILLLLTLPRSGSTLLFDALRCHPSVSMSPRAAVWNALGLNGRRYPRDLSNVKNGVSIATHSGHWEKLPRCNLPGKFNVEHYNIEKLHPEFFKFRIELFLTRVEALRKRGDTIKILYQVRDPRSAITSFMNYQRRSGSWYRHMWGGDKLMRFQHRTWHALLETYKREPGMVIDYAAVRHDLPSTLRYIYGYLWPDSPELVEMLQVSKQSAVKTARGKLRKSPFLGSTPGPVVGNPRKLNRFFTRQSRRLVACYRCYRILLEG